MLTSYSAGFPKVMHLIGDRAYWNDQDLVIDQDDAGRRDNGGHRRRGGFRAQVRRPASPGCAEEPGLSLDLEQDHKRSSIPKQDVEKGLDGSERKKFNNFLQKKMKTLNVLRSGNVAGEYVFNMGLVRLYLFMQRAKLGRKSASA
ncbi:MAG TPA: hypothetical protein VHN14_35585 [Kofleriaceae bacterium]|nr:hypothetical protein [Kofleriaceae bacterium]